MQLVPERLALAGNLPKPAAEIGECGDGRIGHLPRLRHAESSA